MCVCVWGGGGGGRGGLRAGVSEFFTTNLNLKFFFIIGGGGRGLGRLEQVNSFYEESKSFLCVCVGGGGGGGGGGP